MTARIDHQRDWRDFGHPLSHPDAALHVRSLPASILPLAGTLSDTAQQLPSMSEAGVLGGVGGADHFHNGAIIK